MRAKCRQEWKQTLQLRAKVGLTRFIRDGAALGLQRDTDAVQKSHMQVEYFIRMG